MLSEVEASFLAPRHRETARRTQDVTGADSKQEGVKR